MAGRFQSFVRRYSSLFISYREDVSDKAWHYLSGLMQVGTSKNMERVVEVVPDSDHRDTAIHIRFPLVCQRGNKLRCARSWCTYWRRKTCLSISRWNWIFQKRAKPARVFRQWLGCLGKVDNGQVGVLAALCNGNYVTPTNGLMGAPFQYVVESPLKLRLLHILSVNYIKCLRMASKQVIRTFCR